MRKRKQIVVIGLGHFGSSVARTLSELGHEVLGIDRNADAVNAAADFTTQSIQADATSEAVLKEMEVRNFDIGVVSVADDVKSSILVTLLLKRLGVRWVVAKASDELHGEILQRIGADRVVLPETETGVRVAHGLAVPALVDYLRVIPGYGVSKLVAPAAMAGKSLGDLRLKGPAGLTIMLLARGEELILSPGRDEIVRQGDLLVIAGEDERIETLGATEA